jgi:hypothetical protein
MIILQVLLGIMALCATATYWLRDVRHLLYHDPYSIAGVASLLAGM